MKTLRKIRWLRLLVMSIAVFISSASALFSFLVPVLVGLACLLYFIPAAMVWRSLSGYTAWRIHTTAERQTDIRPELEDWIAGTVLTFFVAIPFWWLILPFRFAPNGLKTESEREAENLSLRLKVERLQLENERRHSENERRMKELVEGD